MPKPLAPIGRAIDARRAELGLSLPQLAKASDVSVEQLRAIRYGENSPRAATRGAIERALRWAPGSVGGILDHDSGPVALPPGSGTPPEGGHAGKIAAIRLVYSGEAEGDEEAIVAAVRRAFPGDDIAPDIMAQDHKTLDKRWEELEGWLEIRTPANVRKALGAAS